MIFSKGCENQTVQYARINRTKITIGGSRPRFNVYFEINIDIFVFMNSRFN